MEGEGPLIVAVHTNQIALLRVHRLPTVVVGFILRPANLAD